MSENLTLSLKLLLNSRNLAQGLQQSKSAVSRFASGTRDEINALKSSFNSLSGRIAQLGISISAVQQIMKSAKLDQGLVRVGQTAKATQAQVAELRQELFTMAKLTGNEVDDLKTGFDDLIASGQSWDQALASIKEVNVAIAVTGSNSKVLTSALGVASTAFDFDLSKAGEARKFLDEMTAAGRAGNAELESLADIISRIGTNAASAGMNRQQALAFVETLSLVEKQPERLATLADSTLRLFNNQNYSKQAEKETGVKFFNKDGSRRQVMSVMADMKFSYDKLKTDKEKNNFIFKAFGKADLDNQKGVKTLFTGDMMNKSEGIYQKINTASGTLAKDLPDSINNAVSQTGRLKTAMREAADEFAKPINETLANTIKWGMDKKSNGGLELSGKEMIGGGIAATFAAALGAKFGGKLIGGVLGKFSNLGAGVATGKALENAAGVLPVFVVNMPNGGLAGGLSPTVAAAAGGFIPKAASIGRGLIRKAGVTAALAGGMPLGQFLAAGGMATTAAGVGAAGLVGYGTGSLINKGINAADSKLGTSIGDSIGQAVAVALAAFGNKEAKQALQVNLHIDGRQISAVVETQQRKHYGRY